MTDKLLQHTKELLTELRNCIRFGTNVPALSMDARITSILNQMEEKASIPYASATTAALQTFEEILESYHVALEDNRRDESIKLAAEKYANQFCEIEADSMSIDKLLSEFKRQGIDTTNWDGDEGAEKAIVDGVKNLISSPTTAGEAYLCPKCNGHGTTAKPPYVPGDVHEWSSTAMSHVCDVCNGAKVLYKASTKNTTAGESKEDVLKKHVTGDDKLVVPFEEYLQYDSTKDILAAMEEYAQSPSASFSLEVVEKAWGAFRMRGFPHNTDSYGNETFEQFLNSLIKK